MTHQIQLRGPWEFEWLTPPPDGQAAAGRFTLPLDWQARWGEVSGILACHRWFHRPTNLDENEEVWVVTEGLGGGRRVLLNGETLADVADDQSSVRLNVTAGLRIRNRLTLELAVDASTPAPAGIAGPVWLEIGPKSADAADQAASAEGSQTAE